MSTHGHISTPAGLLLPTVTTPTRALNTTFVPSATRPVLCLYTVQISVTSALSLASADDGQIELRSDAAGVATTVRAQVRNRNLQTLGLLIGSQQLIESELSFLAPPGWGVRLATVVNVAAPTFALVRQTEIIL